MSPPLAFSPPLRSSRDRARWPWLLLVLLAVAAVLLLGRPAHSGGDPDHPPGDGGSGYVEQYPVEAASPAGADGGSGDIDHRSPSPIPGTGCMHTPATA